MYVWYEDVEAELEVLVREAPLVPAHAAAMAESDAATSGLADELACGWPRPESVRAAVGHALEFETWRSLARRQGLSRKQGVEAMTRLVAAA